MRSMFLLLGGALSFIVGLVGVLNFFNAILTGITARRRELAVLQSIGMTARQLRTMLAMEGLLYTVGAAAAALALVLVSAPFLGPAVNSLIWFFTYRFTIWPVAVVLPLFAALGIAIPILSCPRRPAPLRGGAPAAGIGPAAAPESGTALTEKRQRKFLRRFALVPSPVRPPSPG